MPIMSNLFLLFLWVAYLIYWWAKSSNLKADESRESNASRLVRLIVMLTGIVLLAFQNLPLSILDERFLPAGPFTSWAGVLCTAGGLGLSVWARHHLGRNWSQAVTLKADHQLIVSGPYSIVRHPIYCGLLTALLGTAIALDKWRGLLAVLLVLGVLVYKLRLEERWMVAKFGATYEAYARRVSALIPFLI